MADYRAAIERMMATPHGFEWLPQIWHVIYEEGIRGNHILFQDADLVASTTLTSSAVAFIRCRRTKNSRYL